MTFDKRKTVQYWIEGSEYDLETAETLYRSGRYPYSLFFGHLAVEKLLKALAVQHTENHAPMTHSLPLLASKLSMKLPSEITNNLNLFMEFYVEARYPEQQREFYKKCTSEFTRKNLDTIKKVYEWFHMKLDQ
jgi:HEPN domain-containing protein